MMELHFYKGIYSEDFLIPANNDAKNIWDLLGYSEDVKGYDKECFLSSKRITILNNMNYRVMSRNKGDPLSYAKEIKP